MLFILFLVGMDIFGGVLGQSNPAHCHYNGEGTWSVGIMEGSHWSNLSVPTDVMRLPNGEQLACSRNPIVACSDITDINASFTADPFLFFPNGTDGPWYAFFEVKNMNNNPNLRAKRGQIGTAVSLDEGVTWTYLKIVLRANHHLSYPHVFEHKGQIYMMPQGQSMSLYRCTSFPTKWRFEGHLLDKRTPVHDVTAVHYQGRWWAFGIYETYGKGHWKLHVYYANSLHGPWHSTPNNCMTNSSKGTFKCLGEGVTQPHKSGSMHVRPGGRMFVEDGRLYRMVQDSRKLYGDGLNLFEVTSLSVDGPMQETLLPAFAENFRAPHNVEAWNSKRFHHGDLHRLPGKTPGQPDRWVMLTDGDYNRGVQVHARTFPQQRCADVRRTLGL